jgi:hypothetical protein
MRFPTHDLCPGDGIETIRISVAISSCSIRIRVRVLPARDAYAARSDTGDVRQSDAVKTLTSALHDSGDSELTQHLHCRESDEVSEFE